MARRRHSPIDKYGKEELNMDAKNKSPEVAPTTEGLIDNFNQNNPTYDRRTNQKPRHVSFFFARVMSVIISKQLEENGHE